MNKTEKVFNKIRTRYDFLVQNPDLKDLLKNHYDKDGRSILFIIGLLENRIGRIKIFNHIQINRDEWVELFGMLYKEEKLVQFFNKLEINPITPFEQTLQAFDYFDPFINKTINFFKKHDLNLNIDELELKSLLKYTLGYILYNSIECKIPYSFNEILADPDYNTKYIVVLNNTKLFSLVKKGITNNCQGDINNLIMLVLGMSKSLNKTR